jgi:hypothetical protein
MSRGWGLFLAVWACGGQIDAGTDAATPDVTDVSVSACTSPEGYEVCGTNTQCAACPCESNPDAGVGLCAASYAKLPFELCADWCSNDDVCWTTSFAPQQDQCVPFAVGSLLEQYTANTQVVHYADFSSWSGTTLPSPTTCPQPTGLSLCGGACGACQSGQCVGRSPTHAWGFCAPVPIGATCSTSVACADLQQGCFVFAVDAASQALADRNGQCLPKALCSALAAQLPGGGKCL